MSFKNSLRARLSKLTGMGRVEKKAAPSRPDAPKSQPQKPVEPEKPQDPRFDGMGLSLPPEHPVSQLWALYPGRDACTPGIRLYEVPPECAADEPGAPAALLTAASIEMELPRLDNFAAASASERLKKIAPSPDGTVPRVDAGVQVFLTADAMTAWVLAYPPSGGGEELTAEFLKAALDKAHIVQGVDESLLESLPKSKDRYFHLFLAAQGDPPVNGQDGYIIDLFSRVPVRALAEDESGRVDYASMELFQNVKAGDAICRIVQPTPCSDGRTATGRLCYAKAGKPPIVPKGRNTALSEDGESLVASCEGHVEFSGRSFQVKPVMDIGGNVDFSTGNISCLGDVHIHGDVCSGFTVRATGNITVDGVIEACVVEAGGDLVVRKGVQGNGKAILRAHRNVFARFLESCSVYARENLEAECIVSCEVYCDGTVKTRSGRGAIIGGQVRAAREVSANIVGARSECLTGIFLGGFPCEEFERQVLAQQIENYEAELAKLDRQPESPSKLRQMSKLRVQISAEKMKLNQLDKESEAMAKEGRAPGHGHMLCSTLYPGTEITMGTANLRVTQEQAGCDVSLVGGEIVLF